MSDNVALPAGPTVRTIELSPGLHLLMSGLAQANGDDAIAPILAALNRTGANDAFAIANDGNLLSVIPDAILVTADGSLSMRGTGSTPTPFGNVKAGQLIPFRARRVMSGSSATVIGLVY